MINNSAVYPDLIILDVRNQDEYDSKHICDAILLPVAEIESRISDLTPYNDTGIIVYCRSGSRSAAVSQILVDHNFTKIFNMLGGISSWESAGYETCGTGPPSIAFSLNLFIAILIGTILTLITNFALAPEKARAIWDIIKQVFNRYLLN